jgi:hypothetical protein
MPKKRKNNTMIKRRSMIARTALKNLCIAMVLGEAKYCTVMNFKSVNEVKVSQEIAGLIANLPHKWYFECSVVCRDQTGEEYVVSEPVYCESAYRQSDPRLNEFLNKHHKAFLAKQNPMHVITLAWVAVPVIGNVEELDINTLGAIYTKLGAFDYLSTWENNQQEKEDAA